MVEKDNIPMDKNGYYMIVSDTCPGCESQLEKCREVAYPNGEVYIEFDCIKCDFTGRLRKGNLYDESAYNYLIGEFIMDDKLEKKVTLKENNELKALVKALKKSNADYVYQIRKAYMENLSIKELAYNCGIDLE